VPSWLNEKGPGVSVNQVFWVSTLTSTALYTCIGLLGALAFPSVPENMLSLMLSKQVGLPTRVCATLFGVAIIGFGIPIFCVLMRYNLVSGGLCSEPLAHFWSSALPWLTGWTLYQGSVSLRLLSWSGLVLNGFIDFLMPGVVTLASLGAAARARSCWRAWRRSATHGSSIEVGTASPSPPPAAAGVARISSPLKPFPSWLRPYYMEVVASMMGFLLVLLPLSLWLQIYCAGYTVCYSQMGDE
jgi:hypothetical protein